MAPVIRLHVRCVVTRQPLEPADDVEEIGHVIGGDRCDHETRALVALAQRNGVTLLLEALQGGADRGPADAQTPGRDRLDEPRSRRQASRQDELAQFVVRPFGLILRLRPFFLSYQGRFWHGPIRAAELSESQDHRVAWCSRAPSLGSVSLDGFIYGC